MRLASFFSGIGGLELGLEWAGLGPVVFQCEFDAFARRVLEKHWPGVPRHDDITKLDPRSIPEAEVWCGGFPCQDISIAGKGAGLDGDRSGLWWEWLRCIRVVRPRIVVVENVAAFAYRGLDAVLGCLSALGYDTEYRMFGTGPDPRFPDVPHVGGPHRRWRFFIIAHRPASNAMRGGVEGTEPVEAGDGGGVEADPRSDGIQGHVADANPSDARGLHQGSESAANEEHRRASKRPSGKRASTSCELDPHPDGGRREVQRLPEHRDEQRPQGGQPHGLGPGGRGDGAPSDTHLPGRPQQRIPVPAGAQHAPIERGSWWASEPDVGRVAHGVPSRVDRLRTLGNAVVPHCAHVVGVRVLQILSHPTQGGQ